jgi:hypothetical protein
LDIIVIWVVVFIGLLILNHGFNLIQLFIGSISITFMLHILQSDNLVQAIDEQVAMNEVVIHESQVNNCLNKDDLSCAIVEASKEIGIDPSLVIGLIKQESNFKNHLTSVAGAKGYMQVMPFNAGFCGLNEADLEDRHKNISCGLKILASAMVFWDNRYPQNQDKAIIHALAEYNSGRNSVLNRNSVRAFPETRAYVIRVLAYWKLFKCLNVNNYPSFHPHTSTLIVGEWIASNFRVSDVSFLSSTSFKLKVVGNFEESLAAIFGASSVGVSREGSHVIVRLKNADGNIGNFSRDFFKRKEI